ncbi:hypothetical protein [Salinispora cortesiana]|uniref:hypothetical protein n=1 Tax=Salinispora cortesiana TaxID=1305843 RepID=UPI0003F53ABB|nr:hypothetical protein [Salinispora cortesiana]
MFLAAILMTPLTFSSMNVARSSTRRRLNASPVALTFTVRYAPESRTETRTSLDIIAAGLVALVLPAIVGRAGLVAVDVADTNGLDRIAQRVRPAPDPSVRPHSQALDTFLVGMVGVTVFRLIRCPRVQLRPRHRTAD